MPGTNENRLTKIALYIFLSCHFNNTFIPGLPLILPSELSLVKTASSPLPFHATLFQSLNSKARLTCIMATIQI